MPKHTIEGNVPQLVYETPPCRQCCAQLPSKPGACDVAVPHHVTRTFLAGIARVMMIIVRDKKPNTKQLPFAERRHASLIASSPAASSSRSGKGSVSPTFDALISASSR